MTAKREQLTGSHVVREALRARRRELFGLRVAGRVDPEIESAAGAAGVAIQRVDARDLPRDPGGSAQGVALEAGPLPESSLESVLAEADESALLLLLDGVEDPQNLGAIARVAEAAGVLALVLPHRRSAPSSPAATRASAGALEWLPVVRVGNLRNPIRTLREEGFWLLAADGGAEESIFGLSDRALAGRLAVALGAEGRGLRPGVLELADFRARIPMAGRVGSLNVATAGAVFLYEVRRRRMR